MIKELPSIYLIRQCQTVILITCHIITAYSLSKSEKWGTLHKDGTGRLQTGIISFIITIYQLNDPIFPPVIFSASILPEDETAVGLHDAIVSFIEEKTVATEMEVCNDYGVLIF